MPARETGLETAISVEKAYKTRVKPMKTAVFLYLYVTFMDGSASVLVIGPPPGPLPGIVQGFETHEACKAFRDIFMRRLASGQKVAAPTGLRSVEFECAASR